MLPQETEKIRHVARAEVNYLADLRAAAANLSRRLGTTNRKSSINANSAITVSKIRTKLSGIKTPYIFDAILGRALPWPMPTMPPSTLSPKFHRVTTRTTLHHP